MPNQLDLNRYVPALLAFIDNKLSAHAAKLYKDQFNTTLTEFRILTMLAVEPNINAQRIIELIGLDKAGVSRTIKQLHEKALLIVTPDPQDLRSNTLQLTASGQALYDEVLIAAQEREQKLLAEFNHMEIENLIYLLNKLHTGVIMLESK
jgi:DNA-binding MarR family transcriptional regulator